MSSLIFAFNRWVKSTTRHQSVSNGVQHVHPDISMLAEVFPQNWEEKCISPKYNVCWYDQSASVGAIVGLGVS